jgi:ribonuclease HII
VPDLKFETRLWKSSIKYVAGIDEAGRGALAGPVAAAALIFRPDPDLAAGLAGVRDSKQMTARQREIWADKVAGIALTFNIAFASAAEIDELGILPATRLAMRRAVQGLDFEPEHLLVDYVALAELQIPQQALVKGDARSLSIAAASILAKTARDAVLRDLDAVHPGYGFARNKGYGTAAHREALKQMGPCPIHRRTFKGVGDGGQETEVGEEGNCEL